MTRPRVVCDASALVALLLDSGAAGRWATEQLRGSDLLAPTLLPFEVANVLRRHELSGVVSRDVAVQAHADLLDLPVELWPYELVAGRAWALRHDLSSYAASFVALAELAAATLVTLDVRIARAPDLDCVVVTP